MTDTQTQSRVLVVNCGSSSVVLTVVTSADTERELLHLEHRLGVGEQDEQAVAQATERVAGEVDLVAHRLVHGGDRLDPRPIDAAELDRLRSLAWLAPLHLPPAIEAAELVGRLLPDVAAYACFDTQFHAHLDPESRTLPVPQRWRTEHGVRRYGFHGPGHQRASERTALLLDRPLAELDLVTVHLGGGASAAAVHDGHSVDTTMAMTPLAGMAMSTRPGSLDPGVLLHLLHDGVTVDELIEDVNRHSGLLGVSGTSGDLRDLYDSIDHDDARARLAVDVYVRGVAQGIAAMATSLPRLDAIAFTGGAGSASARLRSEVVARLRPFGIVLDDTANARASGGVDALVHDAASAAAVAVVVAHEATVLARTARAGVSP